MLFFKKTKSFSALPSSVLTNIFTEKNIKHIKRIKIIYEAIIRVYKIKRIKLSYNLVSSYFKSICSFNYGLLKATNEASRFFFRRWLAVAAIKKFHVNTCIGVLFKYIDV